MQTTMILFYVFIVIFAITAIITLLGITNVLKDIKDKYLNALFGALILEVVSAVVVMFNSADFKANKAIPQEFYDQSSVTASESFERDIVTFTDLIIKGESSDGLVKQGNHKIQGLEADIDSLTIQLQKAAGTISSNANNFYAYIQQLENYRKSASYGTINLRNPNIDQGILKIIEKIMISNGRLENSGNTQKEIITAFEKFKHDNNRTNTSYKVYLQDVPLFVKEFLEENYELKFKIVNPNIPASVKAASKTSAVDDE